MESGEFLQPKPDSSFGKGASLRAQLVKNPPAMQETRIRSLGWEDLLEKGKATHSSTLAWRIPRIVYSPWGHKESDTTECLSLPLSFNMHGDNGFFFFFG